VSEVTVETVPSLLTVEEAARVLRVGRTKAYAMAQEWRVTGGKSGLPVIDFGNVLRVPLCQLETLLGGPLTAAGASDPVVAQEADAPATGAAPTGGLDATTEEPAPSPAPDTVPAADTNDSTTRRPRRRPRLTQSNQPSLFDSLPD
jgi:hypothetical protein